MDTKFLMQGSRQPIAIFPDGDQLVSEELELVAAPDSPISEAVYTILEELGEDPQREGLLKTPDRVARMFNEITVGYGQDPLKLMNGALFEVDYHEMLVVKDIEFYSLCEHHLLPFFGLAHVAYIPDDRVIGLSKIPRIVEMFARRLQVQERLTGQIADLLEDVLQPRGVAVVIEGQHMCAMMRGVEKSQARMLTRTMRGEFQDHPSLRSEFLAQITKPVR